MSESENIVYAVTSFVREHNSVLFGGESMKRIAIIVLALIMLVGCTPQKQRFSAINIDCFDTVTQIIAYTTTKSEFDELENLVFSELERYHKLFDAYNSHEGVNNIKTINEKAANEPVKVDPELFELLQFSKQLFEKTDGRLNVFLGAVLQVWHEHRENSLSGGTTTVPSRDELSEKGVYALSDNVILDQENLTVFFTTPEVQLDVGAVAKGFVADKIAELLREKGYDSVAISLGGNVITIGKRADGKEWSIGIQDPFDTNGTVESVKLLDTSLVTSGDYQRYYYHEGKKYHHIIDPETLMPAEYFSSVSIICESSALADALSTALFCMSEAEGHSLVSEIGDCEVLWITPDGEITSTLGFEEFVK